jgi:hypothetical protein
VDENANNEVEYGDETRLVLIHICQLSYKIDNVKIKLRHERKMRHGILVGA